MNKTSLSPFLPPQGKGKNRSKPKFPTFSTSTGRKFILKLAVVVVTTLFVLIYNVVAGPKEHTAGVTFLGNEDFFPALVTDISQANNSINCALYMFKTDGSSTKSTKTVEGALLDALSRGVKVSIIFELGTADDITTEYNQFTAKSLEKAGANIVFDDAKQRLHAKMCIIDNRISFVGSHNYTYSGFERNAEVTVRVNSAEVAAEANEFLKSLGLII